jgi:hypothetical protein
MPRRVQIISPNLAVNSSFIARFDDGTWLIVKRDFYGYHAEGGRIHFDCTTKTDLDNRLSFAGEDRGGLDKIVNYDSSLGVTPDGTHIAELFKLQT